LQKVDFRKKLSSVEGALTMLLLLVVVKVLTKTTTTDEAVDLVSRVLLYQPSHRMSAIDVIAHPFFDELRQPHTRLRHGKRLPPLFNFLPEGTCCH